ncbi:MAG: NAD(P)H-dependent glycerol-3-phosphate dehydrogenase, partial [Pseudomonadota bacterium]
DSAKPKFASITLIARTQSQADAIVSAGENERYLPGEKLNPRLRVTADVFCLARTTHVVFVTPAQGFAALSKSLSSTLTQDATLILCSKGVDAASGRTMSEIASTNLPGRQLSVLSGPSFAHDVVRGLPTAVTLGSAGSEEATLALATLLATPTFRIYPSKDVTGVEAGGALKNIFAIAVGVARGLELGASAEAALTARGFAEMTRLAVAMGAKRETLAGLSGLGDLVLTCASPQSRNFAYGMALARGATTPDMPLAEGAKSATAALAIARENTIDVPIIDAVSNIITGTLTPESAVRELLSRPLRSEAPS